MFISLILAVTVALWVAVGVAWCVEKRIFERPVRAWGFLSRFRKCVIGLALFGLIAWAGTKPSPGGGDDMGGSSTNDVTQVEGDASQPIFAGTPSFGGRGPETGTPVAGAEGFSLVSVGHDETFDFAPPENAVVATNWLLHGASTQPLRLAFDDWLFPFGEEVHSNFTVFACGEVMPGVVGTNCSLKPFAAPLGIVPAANWNMVPANGNSCFWSGFSPSNTLLLTWQNALLDRAATNPVSFQAELKPSGGFVFRYDLSRLAADDLLSNVVIAVDDGSTVIDLAKAADCQQPMTNLSSLAFQTHDERVCDENREDFDARLGDNDPYLFPGGSTNTILEHVFYSGTTNGTFAYPQSTDGNAVLMVSVSGSGSGELMVGSTFVPLVGRPAPVSAPRLFAASPPSPSTLAVSVPRGSTQRLYMRGDSTLSVSLSSDDFAFGELPDLSGRHFAGWINFPFVNATVPCIHDYNARQKEVSLPVGGGADDLTCTWTSTGKLRVENRPPRSALLTGLFDGRTTVPVTYTLEHPRQLFGRSSFTQTAHYCPPPPDEEDDDEDPPSWPFDPYGEFGDPDGPGPNPDDPTGDVDPAEEEEPQAEDDPMSYEDASSLPRLTRVLKLRPWPEVLAYADTNRLVAPSERRNCCPCPDHATNWVGVVDKSDRIRVLDEEGRDFRISGETLDVRVIGVAPSLAPHDAELVFATNGVIFRQIGYTVLGVGIGDGAGRLAALNAVNSSFGLPIAVCTNAELAAEISLSTSVGLNAGHVRVGIENATAPFSVWLRDGDTGEWREIVSDVCQTFDVTIGEWRRLSGVRASRANFATAVRISASAPGAATLVYKYWGVVGGKFVEDTARQRLAAVAPPVRADVDRDGDIDATDAQRLADGVIFRFWSNDDTDKGDYIGQSGSTIPNATNLKVDGKLDLVNFFPVQVDVSAFRQAWGNDASFKIRAPWSAGLWHCAVVNGLSSDATDALQTEPQAVAGDAAFDSADLAELDRTGLDLDDVLRPDGTVMLAFEATRPAQGDSGPELVVTLGDAEVFTYRLAANISHVDAMYRYLNLRGAESDASFVPTMPGMPTNLPDEETDGKNYVFVHGYNVNADQSRAWARAMFKRLWWAGSKSKFTAVDWFGDDSQIPVPVVGDVSPNYYQNVVHAFRTAPALKAACDMLQGDKVMLAHSLGNMVVSAAAKDFGLQYAKYYLLNAAVPMEAYDSSASASAMIDGEWSNVPASFRAANWHSLFAGTDDFRTTLTWKGRFAGIANAVNCYSPTEDVLGNPAVGQLTLVGGAWKIQELTKGTTLWNDINVGTFGTQRVSCEGGWGINTRYALDPTWYIYQYGFLMRAQTMTRQMAIEHPPFTPFRMEEDAMHSTNSFVIADAGYAASLKAKFLADAIPAESFAAGANELRAETGIVSYNYQSATPNGWPRKNGDDVVWEHSDIKNVAYYYVHVLFEKIKNLR